MDFKTNKIRKKKVVKFRPTAASERSENQEFTLSHEAGKKIKISLGIFSSIAIIILLMIGVVKAVSSIDIGIFLQIAGDELETDAYNHTNFLLLGHGGGQHDGANLTDTIIVASLDRENKLVSMISIPRDLWIKDDLIGSGKINQNYQIALNYYGSSKEGLEHMKSKVENLMGIPIHYWAKINFQGFEDLIDALGGVTVNVEKPINDPFYPKDGTVEYEPFYLQAGTQILDGDTALKYARSRHTTSDFDRANRQQQILYAIKQKALETEVIFNAGKITDVLNVLKNNIETNITIKEILTLGAIAKDLTPEQISQRLIHDDPTQCGGLLYTPERQYYNNQFVLVPAGGVEFVHMYADLNFSHPLAGIENSKIHVLNGTPLAGIAGEAKQILNRFCFDVIRFGNARDTALNQTTYYYRDPENRPAALDFLQKIIPGEESTEVPSDYLEYIQAADIIIEIGQDYVNSSDYLEDPFYYLIQLYGSL